MFRFSFKQASPFIPSIEIRKMMQHKKESKLAINRVETDSN
jgi:hypothetical protein